MSYLHMYVGYIYIYVCVCIYRFGVLQNVRLRVGLSGPRVAR